MKKNMNMNNSTNIQERRIANLIFEKFSDVKCKANEIVPMRTFRFSLINNLNPKEQELFVRVCNGLIVLGYIEYNQSGLECLRLTEKGYDFIYDEDKVTQISEVPWFIPDMEKPDWAKAQKRLLKYICDEGGAYYLDAKTFYDFVAKIDPNYANKTFDSHATEFVKLYKDENTSSTKYFECLINSLTENLRFELYVSVQKYFEDKILEEDND